MFRYDFASLCLVRMEVLTVYRETDVQVVDDPTPRARPEEFDSRSSYGKSNQRETEYEEEDVGSGQERRRR